MDENTDIEKLEHFLTALRDAEVIDESIIDTCTTVETAQSSNESTENCTTKRKRSKPSDADESAANLKREKIKKLRISVFYNKLYFKLLCKLEEAVTQLILDCAKEKASITHQIQELKTPGSKLRRELVFLYKAKVVALNKFSSSPYFKDVQGYSAPHNKDFIERKKLLFLNSFHVIKRKPWDNDQKRALEKGILAIELEREFNAEVNNSENSSMKIGAQQSLRKRCFKMDDPQKVKQCLIEIIGHREDEYDWLKLSASCLNGMRSSHECRAIWFNYLHPKFRKIPWTELESDTLKLVAGKNGFQNWEKIAEDLGTRRSAYQCMGYYIITLQDVTNIPWTEDEFKMLKLLVEKFKFGHHISWNKIASLMDGRTGVDSFRKWQSRFSDVKKGKFSRDEDILLVAGLRKFGPKWSEIAEYLPNRHSLQVRGRLHVLKGRELAKAPWTPDDDDLLQELLAKYGFGNWSKMCQHFLNRTPSQVRSRCRSLIRYKDKKSAGEYVKQLGRYQRARRDQRSVQDLWEEAVRLMEKKSVKDSLVEDDDQSAVVMEKLSSMLHFTNKRGRKVGQINDSSIQKLFHNFFFVSYGQKGGRGKNKCSKNMIPTMAYELLVALKFLEAKLYFPPESDIVMDDHTLSQMDKDVACYFIHRKEVMQGKCTVINCIDFDNIQSVSNPQTLSTNSESHGSHDIVNTWKYGKYCPPTFASLIAIRTMLLNKINLKSQKNGSTVQKGLSSTDPSEWNPAAISSGSGEIPSSGVLSVGTGPSIITISPSGTVSCYGSKPIQCSIAASEGGDTTTTCEVTEPSVEAPPCIPATTSCEPCTISAPEFSVASLLVASSSASSSGTTSILPITSLALPVVVTSRVPSKVPHSSSPPGTSSSSGPTVVEPSVAPLRGARSIPPMISIPSKLQNCSQLSSFNGAASLFRKRLKMLLGWSGLISTFYPSCTRIAEEHIEEEIEINEEDDDTSSVLEEVKQPKKRGRKKKRRGRKEDCQEKEVKVKRPYVKSGKYVSDPRPTEASRKSSRIPKKKLE